MAERTQQPPPQEEAGVKHVDFIHPIGSRDGTLTRDPKMVNCYPEQTELGVVAKKRPGMVLARSYPAGEARGQFLHKGVVQSIINDVIYSTATGGGIGIAGESSGLQLNFLSDTPFGLSGLKTKLNLWTLNSVGAFTQVTDAGYPAETTQGLTYLDGYYFVMAVDGTIQHSAVLNPMSWPALNFIGSDLSYGTPRTLSRHLNYIAAFYAQGLQMFYNAGNATGSVLAPVGNANWRTGCALGESVLNINDETYFMAHNGAGGRSIQKLSGLSLGRVSDDYIDRILARSTLAKVFVNDIRTDGHSFYTITLTDLNLTLAYDTVMNHWTVWSTETNGVEGYFKGIFAVNRGDICYLQNETNGQLIRPEPFAYRDSTGPINFRVVTPCHDWGTLKRKYMPAVFLIADTVPSTVLLRYSDKDYANPSNWRSINLATDRKMALKMGSSIRRSWEIWHTADTPFRAFTLQLDIARGAE